MRTPPLPVSPRSRLHAKLKQSKDARTRARPVLDSESARGNVVSTVPTLENTFTRLRIFPQWLTEQLVRSFPTVVHNTHPFMLLFRFDMTGDPITMDATSLVGSRMDILLVKINGGIYYESSTHMDGLQNRITSMGRSLRLGPEQLLYVCNPDVHVHGACADIMSDVSKLSYVAEGIPASFVRDAQVWDVPLDITRHLPSIKQVDESPQ